MQQQEDRYAPYHSACNGPNCKQQVLWARTIGGANMPLDPDLTADGNVVLETTPRGRRARILTGNELPALKPCYVPHHRTCVDSSEFRRRQDVTAPKCRARCGTPMDPWLAEHGYDAHICCLPPLDLRDALDTARQIRAVEATQELPGLGGAA